MGTDDLESGIFDRPSLPHLPNRGSSALTAVVVDDEELAREKMRRLLADEPRLRLSAECKNGRQAVETILKLRPDLVFLDIQMPDLDGFGVIREIRQLHMPTVIFTTAHDEFAVRAFDAGGADYLLKPFDGLRFRRAVERALERHARVQVDQLDEHVQKLVKLTQEERESSFPDRLLVKHGGTVHLLKLGEVDWIEASRNYVKIHTGDKVHVMRETMSHIEKKLDPDRFVRIHRSTIVNVDRISKIEPGYGSESRVELENGTHLMISRAYRRGRLKKLLEELN